MEYTVKKLARIAGISPRTLRYYDEIGLLKPNRISSAGYRIYGQIEVDLLQQILFYRELGVSLDKIKDLLTDPNFDKVVALREHRRELYSRRKQLNQLIETVENTLAAAEGGNIMKDQDKFNGFKKQMVAENEERYGKEIRTKYGEKAVEQSNQKVLDMTPEQYDEVTRLSQEYMALLQQAFQIGDPGGDLAQQAVDLHRQWLSYFWPNYSKEAHMGLAQMYVDDERFTAYYDAQQPGTAAFLRDAVRIYTGVDRQ